MQEETVLACVVIGNQTHKVYFQKVYCGETGERYLAYHEIELAFCDSTGEHCLRDIQAHDLNLDLQEAVRIALQDASPIVQDTASRAAIAELGL